MSVAHEDLLHSDEKLYTGAEYDDLLRERNMLVDALETIVGSVAWSPTFTRALTKARAVLAVTDGR